MPEEQYYTYEPEEEEEMLQYMRPDVIRYDEQLQLPQPIMPTRWPRYATQFRPAIQHTSVGEILMSDLEEDEENETSEQLEFVEEVEEEAGLAGFWKPNMLY